MLMAKAGADVPADRKAGIVAGYRERKRMAALLRQPRTAADEPSNIFSLRSSCGANRHERDETPARSFHCAGRPAAARGHAELDGPDAARAVAHRSLDPLLHAFVLVTKERALADAERADRELKSGIDKGPMHGIPYALKDIYATAGIHTTCHSKLLIDNIPSEDSMVEAKFKAGGAVLLGKLATHGSRIGGPSFDLPFPPARNPWNLDHFTGGSSSGSGAAVAAGLVRTAMGSDTGGSIRGPAFYCGTVGIKPTYGLVSRRGVFPLSYTLDHSAR